MAPKRLGMWLFIASDAVTFATLLGVYAYRHGPRMAQGPSAAVAAALTVLLLASGLAMARGWLWGTIGCGAGFLVLHLVEWGHLLRGAPCPGAAFFALTGMHMLHVAAGVGCLAYLAIRRGSEEDVAVCRLYWYFVDAVWLVLCPLVYFG